MLLLSLSGLFLVFTYTQGDWYIAEYSIANDYFVTWKSCGNLLSFSLQFCIHIYNIYVKITSPQDDKKNIFSVFQIVASNKKITENMAIET